VEARTAQWSFAVSLFEALSGKRPFGERVASDVTPVAAILAHATAGRQPPVPGPRWLGRIVRRCLEVDPARRYASMDAVAQALERGLGRRRRALAAVVAAAVVATVGITLALRPPVPPKQWAPVLLAHNHPRTISGDGTTLVFASLTEIWTERRGGGGRRTFPLPEGVDGIYQAVASYHGERAFLRLGRLGPGGQRADAAGDEIWEIDLATGKATERWPAGESRTLARKYPLVDVAPDGATLLLTVNEDPDNQAHLWRLDASGHGRPIGDAMEMIHAARWSPDGRLIARGGGWSPRVDVLDADSGRVLETLL